MLSSEIGHVDDRSFSVIRSLAPRLAGTTRQIEEAVMGMKVGYARVSTTGQKLDVQMDRLAECDRIYHEKMSASSAHTRPELQKALDFVRDEDVFIVTGCLRRDQVGPTGALSCRPVRDRQKATEEKC